MSETSGRPAVAPDADLAAEVAALAELLAQLVRLTRHNGGHWPGLIEHVAEMALEHDSVRVAVAAEDGS